MKNVLFMNSKNIYKANLHCHTTVSDGSLTPEEIKTAYTAKGYSIVAFTDHRILRPQSHLNDSTFLAVNACEMDLNESVSGKSWGSVKTYHLNLYAVNPEMTETPPVPRMSYSDAGALNEYIRDRNNEGFLVCYNHPYWSLQDYTDYSKLKGLFAMEIYNHGCEMEGYYGYSPQPYDEMLRAGNTLHCVSADDNHNRHPLDSAESDSFGGYVMIGSASLHYEDVMDALMRGNFYSTQGPEIYELSLENNKLFIKCSDADLIAVYTDSRRCYLKRGGSMTEAEFEITGQHKYIRVMIRDKNKKDANSNAFWL